MSTICSNLTVLALAAVLSGGAYAATQPDDTQINAEVQKQINERPSLRFYNRQAQTRDADSQVSARDD
jgi:hypothetical protein